MKQLDEILKNEMQHTKNNPGSDFKNLGKLNERKNSVERE